MSSDVRSPWVSNDDPIVDTETMKALADAIRTMKEYLEEIRAYRRSIVPSLYGPYSYEYTINVSPDGGDHGQVCTVRNDGYGDPWEPKAGDVVPATWRRRLHVRFPPDTEVRVMPGVQHADIPEVLDMRKKVEADSPTMEDLINSLTKEDCDVLEDCFEAIQHNIDVINVLGPCAHRGEVNSGEMDDYIRDNWQSDSSKDFGKKVDRLEKQFVRLFLLLKEMAEGYLSLSAGLMAFVTAITQVLDIRAEQTREEFDKMMDGGSVAVGIFTGWKSAQSWLDAALFVVDVAGEDDSTDRRAAMDSFNQSRIGRDVSQALTASQGFDWPSFDDAAPQENFGEKS